MAHEKTEECEAKASPSTPSETEASADTTSTAEPKQQQLPMQQQRQQQHTEDKGEAKASQGLQQPSQPAQQCQPKQQPQQQLLPQQQHKESMSEAKASQERQQPSQQVQPQQQQQLQQQQQQHHPCSPRPLFQDLSAIQVHCSNGDSFKVHFPPHYTIVVLKEVIARVADEEWDIDVYDSTAPMKYKVGSLSSTKLKEGGEWDDDMALDNFKVTDVYVTLVPGS